MNTYDKAKCSTCAFFNGENGYCRKLGKDVNPLQMEDCTKYIATESVSSHEPERPTTKVCKDCGRELPLDAFGFHKSGVRKCVCRECQGRRLKAARDAKIAKNAKKLAPSAKQLAPNANLTDAQMVALLREHGWVVTCTRTITEEL